MWCANYVGSGQKITHSVTGEVVEPVPAQSLVPDVPLVDGSYVTLSVKEVAGSDLISKHAKLRGVLAKDGQASEVAHPPGEHRLEE